MALWLAWATMASPIQLYLPALEISSIYHIMQIVCSGKLSRLHDLVIHRKTFVIVQQFETPYNKKEKICWKTFAIGS